eukprot:scaffold299754_cov20-Prasinocladus_malaysianus.AAC.1
MALDVVSCVDGVIVLALCHYIAAVKVCKCLTFTCVGCKVVVFGPIDWRHCKVGALQSGMKYVSLCLLDAVVMIDFIIPTHSFEVCM